VVRVVGETPGLGVLGVNAGSGVTCEGSLSFEGAVVVLLTNG